MNYKHLEYFWMVVRKGSITNAANSMHVSHQAISAQLAALEAELGHELFLHKGRSLELTDDGKTAFAYADDIFSLGDELSQLFARGDGRPKKKRLRIGVESSLGRILTYRLLTPLFRVPATSGPIVLHDTADVLGERLAEHRLDLTLTHEPLRPRHDVDAHSYLLGESELSFLGAPSLTRLAQNQPFPALLANIPLILPPRNFRQRINFDRWIRSEGVKPLIGAVCDDSSMMNMLARKGIGLIMVPSTIAADVQEQYELRELTRCDAFPERVFVSSLRGMQADAALKLVITNAQDGLFDR